MSKGPCVICSETYCTKDGIWSSWIQLFCGHIYRMVCRHGVLLNNIIKCPLCSNETKIPKVYLAGKMHCWIPSINSYSLEYNITDYEKIEKPCYVRTGPYRLDIPKKDFGYLKDVQILSMKMMDNSDYFCVTIDSMDCFGTIAEIGYAYAKGKQIILSIRPSINLRKTDILDLWFPIKLCLNSMKEMYEDVIKRETFFKYQKMLPQEFQNILKLIEQCENVFMTRGHIDTTIEESHDYAECKEQLNCKHDYYHERIKED